MYEMFEKVVLKETKEEKGTGWLPPLPDTRDYTEETPEIIEIADKLGVKDVKSVPANIDLRSFFSPIEDQKSLGSCTANAAAGIVEYCERRAYGKYLDASRLFIYKITRDILGVTGDTGAWLRNTLGTLVLAGVPPEKFWPYTDKKPDFDKEPPGWVYAIADNFESLRYFCHDPLGMNRPTIDVLNSVKAYLAAGFPSMFGFFGFPSFNNTDTVGGIPFPCPGERAQWGHAIVAAGYDDNKVIKNTKCNKTTTGALLIRNSWGEGWGDKGYGWLPYEYILNKYAQDFWTLISMEWVDTDQFGYR